MDGGNAAQSRDETELDQPYQDGYRCCIMDRYADCAKERGHDYVDEPNAPWQDYGQSLENYDHGIDCKYGKNGYLDVQGFEGGKGHHVHGKPARCGPDGAYEKGRVVSGENVHALMEPTDCTTTNLPIYLLV